MGRPTLPLGTYGSISTERYGKGYRARTYFRDFDGVTRRVERHGKTRGAAENNLREALRDRGTSGGSVGITRETRLNVLAEEWWKQVEAGKLSISTKEKYRYRLDGIILPALGNLKLRELTVSVLHRHLTTVGEKHGKSSAKMVRTVLSGVLTRAVQEDALDRNPVREVASLDMGPKKLARALTVEQCVALRAALRADKKATDRDLPEFVDLMLATGLRIGEAAAVVWDAVDLEARTVEVRGTVIRIKGKGLMIKEEPKTDAGYRTLVMPAWAVEILKGRLPDSGEPRGGDVVFPAVMGGLRDPSNTAADLRDAFDDTGFDWVTSHVFRKTVATLMDRAGLGARAAADQLGHSKVSMTQDNYYGRNVADTGAATVLEALVPAAAGGAASAA
ncbi:tyrosine recombinase XerC [Cryptosporangium sp. NPDC051539]|uniref:tyrosine recombinase XerC n=1 Tax=Cryptosporangium sp. NPDC051539 TaxID=3363962 RepID=UPI003792CB46